MVALPDGVFEDDENVLGHVSEDRSSTSIYDERFNELFGISKEDLRSKGVDPDVYMRKNLRSALNDPKRQAIVLSESTRMRLRFFEYAKRSYVCIFGALIFLLLTSLHGLGGGRTALFALSCASVVMLGFCAGMQISFAKRYRSACKKEGITSRLYRRR